jgi:hypothetical protein
LILGARLTQGSAAFACALTDHAHEAGRAPITDVITAQVALRAGTRDQTDGAVNLRVAAFTFGVLDERVATRARAAIIAAEGIALDAGWR